MVLPKGRTVFTSFLVTSPALIAARMPPPFVTATTVSYTHLTLPTKLEV